MAHKRLINPKATLFLNEIVGLRRDDAKAIGLPEDRVHPIRERAIMHPDRGFQLSEEGFLEVRLPNDYIDGEKIKNKLYVIAKIKSSIIIRPIGTFKIARVLVVDPHQRNFDEALVLAVAKQRFPLNKRVEPFGDKEQALHLTKVALEKTKKEVAEEYYMGQAR